MSFEVPARQGRGKQDTPPVSIGARKRGKEGKLTPYVMFSREAAVALFGSDSGLVLQMAIGSEDHEGWIKLVPDPEGNVKLRQVGRKKPDPAEDAAGDVCGTAEIAKDLVVESRLIPHDGRTKLRRSAAEFEVDEGLLVKLPWAKKGKKDL